jgi:hypothetical protein
MEKSIYHVSNKKFESFSERFIGTGEDPNSALGFFATDDFCYLGSMVACSKILNKDLPVYVYKLSYKVREVEHFNTPAEYYGDEMDDTYCKEHFVELRADLLEDGVNMVKYEDDHADMYVLLDIADIKIEDVGEPEKFGIGISVEKN